MISPSRVDLIAALAGLLATGGVVLGLVGLVGTTRPPGPPSRPAVRARRWWTGSGRSAAERRARQAALLGGAVAGALTWLLTGWPVAGLIVVIALPGIPWLLATGGAEKKAIAKLEAVEAWTRRLADIVERGIGLHAAVVSTAPTAPTLIQHEVRDLAARLQAGADSIAVLRQFADDIADYTCDQVIAPLILQVTDRSEALAAVLTDIARSISAEIEMRSTVNAKRAGPRFAVRFLTGMTIGLLLYGVLNPTYLRPYGALTGQLILAVLAALYVVLMAWVSKLSRPDRLPRLLAPTDHPAAAEVSL